MNEKITIILPISRDKYLARVFYALESLICSRNDTNLIAIVDGDDDLFLTARNYVSTSKFNEVLCVRFEDKSPVPSDLIERRVRISNIHNQLKKEIGDCKYIFGIEDDTVIPSDALIKLLESYRYDRNAGFVEGVELGRWKSPYVGAWKADDIYEPKLIKSLMPHTGVDRSAIDAGGLYCFLTRRELYVNHEFKPFEDRGMGPDVDFGMSLRRLGYSNYIDWRVKCLHKSDNGDLSILTTEPEEVYFMKRSTRWSFYKN